MVVRRERLRARNVKVDVQLGTRFDCPGEQYIIVLREGSSPGGAETRHPDAGSAGLGEQSE